MLKFTGERIVPQADNCEPNFASRMMHEHLVRYLFAGQLVAGKSVLDVGCGVGYGAQKLGQLGAASVTAFDISPDAITHAARFYSHPAVRFELGNAENFTLGEKFDIVTCFEMIEHVEHPDRVLRCIKRHIKPDGILIASTPRFLGEKRTHFHVREFTLEEYSALIERFFPNTKMYVENNHFSSLILSKPAPQIERAEYLKEQFSVEQADVFISVSCAAKATQPQMQPSVVFDDDRYVQMLERDVAILHKAEDDVRASLEAERAESRSVIEFKDAEIARLVNEYSVLFERAQTDSADFARTYAELEKAQAECADKNAELARLVGEYNTLFERAQADNAELARTRSELDKAQAECADRNAELARLVGEYNTLFERAQADNAELARTRSELDKAQAECADRNAEIARLVGEYNTLFERAQADNAELARTCAELEKSKAESADRGAEIAGLVGKFNALFERSQTDRAELARTRSELEEAQAVCADRHTEIARLVGKYNALFERAQADRAELARTRSELEETQAECADRHTEIARLVGKCNALAERAQADRAELTAARSELEETQAECAYKNIEIARLVDENGTLFERAKADRAQFAETKRELENAHRIRVEQLEGIVSSLRTAESELLAELDAEKTQARIECSRRDDQIERLTAEGHSLRVEIADMVDQLKGANMKVADLKLEQEELQKTVNSLVVRVTDADARRLEAYDFARVTSNEALAVRRELDVLKRDLVEAIDFPDGALSPPASDPRHRDIVESMERLFIGTEATHASARNPLVVRVASLASENRRLTNEINRIQAEAREEIDRLQAEAREQRGRAERAEAFGEDWHEQILNLRKSVSWRSTKPLRAIGRLFK